MWKGPAMHQHQVHTHLIGSTHVLTWQVVDGSRKIVTLLDLCGQSRFLKTTLFGLTAHVSYRMQSLTNPSIRRLRFLETTRLTRLIL